MARTNLSRKPKQAAGWNWSPKFSQKSFIVGAGSFASNPHLGLDGEQFQTTRTFTVEPPVYSIQSLEANIIANKQPNGKPTAAERRARE